MLIPRFCGTSSRQCKLKKGQIILTRISSIHPILIETRSDLSLAKFSAQYASWNKAASTKVETGIQGNTFTSDLLNLKQKAQMTDLHYLVLYCAYLKWGSSFLLQCPNRYHKTFSCIGIWFSVLKQLNSSSPVPETTKEWRLSCYRGTYERLVAMLSFWIKNQACHAQKNAVYIRVLFF